jgi:hypothetical protein
MAPRVSKVFNNSGQHDIGIAPQPHRRKLKSISACHHGRKHNALVTSN